MVVLAQAAASGAARRVTLLGTAPTHQLAPKQTGMDRSRRPVTTVVVRDTLLGSVLMAGSHIVVVKTDGKVAREGHHPTYGQDQALALTVVKKVIWLVIVLHHPEAALLPPEARCLCCRPALCLIGWVVHLGVPGPGMAPHLAGLRHLRSEQHGRLRLTGGCVRLRGTLTGTAAETSVLVGALVVAVDAVLA